jgi:hypothetical protein
MLLALLATRLYGAGVTDDLSALGSGKGEAICPTRPKALRNAELSRTHRTNLRTLPRQG